MHPVRFYKNCRGCTTRSCKQDMFRRAGIKQFSECGVRQRCVLSPRLFCAVLHVAMGGWRRKKHVDTAGIDVYDNLPKLLDIRFADDVFVFTTSSRHAAWILNELVRCCRHVGAYSQPKENKNHDDGSSSSTTVDDSLRTDCGDPLGWHNTSLAGMLGV